MIPRSFISQARCLYQHDQNSHYYLADYQNNRQAIIDLKYCLNLTTTKAIVEKLADLLPEQLYEDYPLETDWLIVPVPLYWLSRLKRRFDLNKIIAKKLANHIDNLTYCNAIKNVKSTKQGDCKTRSARKQNAKDKFKVRKRHVAQIKCANIIIFDDVVASGSTMKAVEKILKSVGAKNIIWLSVAH